MTEANKHKIEQLVIDRSQRMAAPRKYLYTSITIFLIVLVIMLAVLGREENISRDLGNEEPDIQVKAKLVNSVLLAEDKSQVQLTSTEPA